MKEEIKFKLGDRVYAPFHGYGVVTAIHEDACVYPIEVTWDDSGLKNMEDASTFTADGLLSKYYANTDTILTVVKGSHKRNRRKEMSASKFKVGDRVYNPSHGYGVVTEIKDDEQEYPNKCLKVAGSTPDSEMLAWSPVHNRFRLMRSFRYYAGAIEDIIDFLEKEKNK